MGEMEEEMEEKEVKTEPERGRSRARKPAAKSRKPLFIALGLLAAAAVGAGAGYAGYAQQYKDTFLPNTRINGIEAEGMTVDEVKQHLAGDVTGYRITITGRTGEEVLPGDTIGLVTQFDGTLERMISEQNPYSWLSHRMNAEDHTVGTQIVYNEERFNQAVDALSCLAPENTVKPENAYISDYIQGTGYKVMPETEGSELDKEGLKEVLSEAVLSLKPSLDLEEAGLYRTAAVKSDDAGLNSTVNELNKIASMIVTYEFESQREVLSGDRIHTWIVKTADGSYTVDDARVAEYVKELADKYDTAGKSINFKTSYGSTISVKSPYVGYKINQAEESTALKEMLLSGQSGSREPVYSQKGNGRGTTGLGSTYAEVNLTGQHMYFYKNGKLVVESDFVSGNTSKGWGTPAGLYKINYTQKNAVLRGENYETPVSFWMPFNGGIGFHDATWRGSFGGSIYKTNGSHGCINMPYSAAKTLFENISSGVPVVCYKLGGTESGSSSSAEPIAATTAAESTAESTEASQEAPGQNPDAAGPAPGQGTDSAAPGSPSAGPTSAAPTSAAPTSAASSEAPASAAPGGNQAPTSAAPTSAAPTSAAPTSAAPGGSSAPGSSSAAPGGNSDSAGPTPTAAAPTAAPAAPTAAAPTAAPAEAPTAAPAAPDSGSSSGPAGPGGQSSPGGSSSPDSAPNDSQGPVPTAGAPDSGSSSGPAGPGQ